MFANFALVFVCVSDQVTSQVDFGCSFKITHRAGYIIVLSLLSQYEFTGSKPLVMSDQVIVTLETFATCCTFKFLSMDIHVPPVHLLVSEHQGALVTGELLPLVQGSGDSDHLATRVA